MDQRALTNQINLLLDAESRSLFNHLDEAQPYVDGTTLALWRRVRAMSGQNREHQRRLSALLVALDLPEQPGAFASEVAFYHFTDVPTLLPLLVRESQEHIAAYRRTLAVAQDVPQARAELETLCAEHERQLAALREEEAALGQRSSSPSSAADS